MPSITAILVLMFTCLCILCCGAGVEDGGGNRGQGDGVRQALRAWFGPEPPVLFSVVLRGLFRQSDPNRFQNIFTTIFTLFTLLTLDDWSQIYVDSRANGGAGPRLGGGQEAGWWADPEGIACLLAAELLGAGKKVTAPIPPLSQAPGTSSPFS